MPSPSREFERMPPEALSIVDGKDLRQALQQGRDAVGGRNRGEAARGLLLNGGSAPMAIGAAFARNVSGPHDDDVVCLMLQFPKNGFAECGATPQLAAARTAAVAKLARDTSTRWIASWNP